MIDMTVNTALETIDGWRQWVEDNVSDRTDDDAGVRLANYLMVLRDFIDTPTTRMPTLDGIMDGVKYSVSDHALALVANAEDPAADFYDCTGETGNLSNDMSLVTALKLDALGPPAFVHIVCNACHHAYDLHPVRPGSTLYSSRIDFCEQCESGNLAVYRGMSLPIFCHDERHGTPCPLPCSACDEECDHSTWGEEEPEILSNDSQRVETA